MTNLCQHHQLSVGDTSIKRTPHHLQQQSHVKESNADKSNAADCKVFIATRMPNCKQT